VAVVPCQHIAVGPQRTIAGQVDVLASPLGVAHAIGLLGRNARADLDAVMRIVL